MNFKRVFAVTIFILLMIGRAQATGSKKDQVQLGVENSQNIVVDQSIIKDQNLLLNESKNQIERSQPNLIEGSKSKIDGNLLEELPIESKKDISQVDNESIKHTGDILIQKSQQANVFESSKLSEGHKSIVDKPNLGQSHQLFKKSQKDTNSRVEGENNDIKEGEEQQIGWMPKLDPKKSISFIIHIILAISGCYVALFGFRVFRLLMIILGFYVSYYGILFALTELKVFKSDDIGHQMGLFFGCIILGFIISILCYMMDKINFIIFGLAASSVLSLFAAQFFIDFKSPDDRIILLALYLSAAFIFSALAFFVLDHFIIWGSAFIGSIITPINVGVVFGDFKSFEDREKLPRDRWLDLKIYLIVCAGMFIVGLCVQYYLRRRIIKRMQDSNLEEIRGTAFLN